MTPAEFLIPTTPTGMLTPVVILLALIGYITCLSRFFLVTAVLSMGFALGMSSVAPIGPSTMIYWVSAFVILFLCAAVALRLRRARAATAPARDKATRKGRDIVIDGTNVMYWTGEADLSVLEGVVQYLLAKDWHPYVFLDASTRHHLNDKSLNEKSFANALGLAKNRVMVCPAKTEADAFILRFAKQEQLPVVSNDRFGDRAAQAKGLKLVKGVFARGKPILEGL